MNIPPINWFGSMLIARDLLSWTKANAEEDSTETFIAKMNRPNWIQRISMVMTALNRYGPTESAAKAIQCGGNGFFTDVSAEALAEKLEDSVAALKSNGVFKFRVGEFGQLDFAKSNADYEEDCEKCKGGFCCDDDDDETDDDDEEEEEEVEE